MNLLDWLESRTGYRGLLALMLDEPVPGGVRWWYVFGSVTTVILVLQFVTGVFLAFFYAPSSTTAWASVAFIQDTVTLGWFMRGLHATGASAMVILTCLHLGQVLLWGAYKAPRELNWMVGVLMLGLVAAFALTGYLLPWDQKGYWATQVATGIIGTLPGLGSPAQTLLLGGTAYGNYTLTHFFALHTFVLPAVILALLGGHIYLFRRHGVTPQWGVPDEELRRKQGRFWPDQLFLDMVVASGVVLVMVVLVVRTHGAELEAPADPSSAYVARPEWYFLPLFQLLKYFEGELEVIGTVILPGLAGLALLALPFLDRSTTRDPRRRLLFIGGGALGFAGLGMLGLLASRQDAADPEIARQRAEASERAEYARRLAREGVPPEGGTAVYRNDPLYRVKEIWNEHCAKCHSLSGRGGAEAPDLHDYNSRAWIVSFLENPNSPLRMGPAKLVKGMKPVAGTGDEIRALAEFVYSQSGAPDVNAARADKGKALFPDKDCDACHETDGTTAGNGPNLGGRGTQTYVESVIADAGAEHRYGKRNKMPKFGGKLSPDEITEMAKFVIGQRK